MPTYSILLQPSIAHVNILDYEDCEFYLPYTIYLMLLMLHLFIDNISINLAI